MNALKVKVEHFNQLITNGETVKAMELYYADEVELQENEEPLRRGKQACIDHEIIALDQFELVIDITGHAVDEAGQLVFSEYLMIITDKISKTVRHRREISVHDGKAAL